MNNDTTYLECDCRNPEHIVRIALYHDDIDLPPEIHFDIQAHNWKPFHKRVWAAIKYVFGQDLVWDDVLLSRKDEVDKLKSVLDQYYERYDDYLKCEVKL